MSDMKVSGIPFWGVDLATWETVNIGGHEIPGICTIKGTGFKLKASIKRAAGQDGANVAMLGRDLASFTIGVKMWAEAHLEAFKNIIEIARPRKQDIVSKNKVKTGQWIDLTQNPQTSESFSPAKSTLLSFVRSSMSSEGNVSNGSQNKFEKNVWIESSYTETKVIGYEYLPLKISHPALELFGIREATIQSISIPQEEQPGLWSSQIDCTEFDRASSRVITRPKSARGDVPLMHKVEGAAAVAPSNQNVGPRD